jgi:hypothetical protein
MAELYQILYRIVFGATLIYVGFILLFVIAIFYFLKKIFRKIGAYQQIFDRTIFLITLPKESLEEKEKDKRLELTRGRRCAVVFAT